MAVDIFELLKSEVQNMSRLRHPRILRVIQTVLDSKTEIAMVTEPIFCSLSNQNKDYTNLAPVPSDLKSASLCELEVKLGLAHVCEALSFLHSDAQTMHLNVAPENIYITKKGEWKLAGFSFSQQLTSTPPPPAVGTVPTATRPTATAIRFGEGAGSVLLTPNLDFAAPELVAGSPSPASDLFSLGCLVYSLLSGSRASPVQCRAAAGQAAHQAAVDRMSQMTLLPHLAPLCGRLLSANPTLRWPLPQNGGGVSESDPTSPWGLIFSDPHVCLVRGLERLVARDMLGKVQLLKEVPSVLKDMVTPRPGQTLPPVPPRVVVDKVMGPLVEVLRTQDLILFVLPSILIIAEYVDPSEFTSSVMPALAHVFDMRDPPKIPLVLLENSKLLFSKMGYTNTRAYMVPFLSRCVEHTQPEVQLSALKVISQSTADSVINAADIRSTILPKILALCQTTPHAGVRANMLVCVGKLCVSLDRDTLTDSVLPVIEAVAANQTLQKNTTLMMTLLGVFDVLSRQLPTEVIARRVLPSLIPLSIDRSLDLGQFSKWMRAIQGMLARVEKERLSELEDQVKLDAELKQAQALSSPTTTTAVVATPSPALSPVFSAQPKIVAEVAPKPPSLPPVPVQSKSALPPVSGDSGVAAAVVKSAPSPPTPPPVVIEPLPLPPKREPSQPQQPKQPQPQIQPQPSPSFVGFTAPTQNAATISLDGWDPFDIPSSRPTSAAGPAPPPPSSFHVHPTNPFLSMAAPQSAFQPMAPAPAPAPVVFSDSTDPFDFFASNSTTTPTMRAPLLPQQPAVPAPQPPMFPGAQQPGYNKLTPAAEDFEWQGFLSSR